MGDERGAESPKSWLNRLTNLLTNEPDSRAELLAIVQSAGQRGILDAESQRIIESTLRVADMQVREIMVPRAQIISIRDNSEPKDFLPVMMESAHSRFPVLATDNSDEVMGILLAKDMLRLIGQKNERFNLKDYLRPAFCVSESAHLDRLLREFKDKQSHMAVVVDEYGVVHGLLTPRDLLEAITGELLQATPTDEAWATQREDGSWLVDGLMPVTEFKARLGIKELPDEDRGIYNTVAGLVMAISGELPVQADVVAFGEWRFEVVDLDGRRIDKLLVSRLT